MYTESTFYPQLLKKPDGMNPPSSKELPVTQLSYNDANAYCEWSGTSLPTYDQYWNLV